jgi:hypothetical protein
VNQLAHSIVEQSISETAVKNPSAVALGRLGGLKGGKVRMSQLTPEERSELGSKAAKKRWGKS